MNLKQQLINAVDYAIESEYSAWFIPEDIRERLRNVSNICLFGAGGYFLDLQRKGFFKRFTPDMSINYVCDNDESKHGKYFETNICHAKCISFEQLKLLKDVVVIITVGNYYQIKKELDTYGIENFPFCNLHLRLYDTHYSKQWFEFNKGRILEAYDLFNDNKSKEVYTEVICNRIAPVFANKSFDELKEENEYFTTRLFEIIPEEECIVDCGAFTGDSLCQYMQLFNRKVKKYYCLELNNKIADICEKVIEEYNNNNIQLIRAGVSDKNENIQISDTGTNASNTRVTSDQLVEARLVRLDDILKHQKVTYIKMDIEGEEISALKGAQTIIKEQTPKLGISAYHFLSDLWEVPLWIHATNKNYKLYLRHHTAAGWDTNCYAAII